MTMSAMEIFYTHTYIFLYLLVSLLVFNFCYWSKMTKSGERERWLPSSTTIAIWIFISLIMNDNKKNVVYLERERKRSTRIYMFVWIFMNLTFWVFSWSYLRNGLINDTLLVYAVFLCISHSLVSTLLWRFFLLLLLFSIAFACDIDLCESNSLNKSAIWNSFVRMSMCTHTCSITNDRAKYTEKIQWLCAYLSVLLIGGCLFIVWSMKRWHRTFSIADVNMHTIHSMVDGTRLFKWIWNPT